MKGIVRGICGLALVAALVVLPSAGALGDAPEPILMYPEGESPGRFSPKQFTARLDPGAPEAVWKQAPGETQPHNVISDRHLFESPFIEGSYKLQLSAGSYPYFCSLHGTRDARHARHRLRAAQGEAAELLQGEGHLGDPNSESGDRFDVDWRPEGLGELAPLEAGHRRPSGHLRSREQPDRRGAVEALRGAGALLRRQEGEPPQRLLAAGDDSAGLARCRTQGRAARFFVAT